ncbi:MAG: diguanylate cyclase [Pseudomonadales bacterium]|nr:diguanylate cyclase [Pseudomonadales bacterium]
MSEDTAGQSETRKWKDKYFSSVEDLENREQDFESQLDIFRRGLVRVSLAADGVDQSLDEHLSELRNCLRGNAAPGQLEELLQDIEESVRNLDEQKQRSFSELEEGYQKLINSLKIKKLSRKTKGRLKSFDRNIKKSVDNRHSQVQLINDYGDILEEVLQQLTAVGKEGKGVSFWQRFLPLSANKSDASPTKQEFKTSYAKEDVDGLELDADFQDNMLFDEQIAKERVVGIIIALLDQLSVPEMLKGREHKIRALLKRGVDWEELPETLSETISLVTGGRIAAQREFETFLLALNGRLAEIHHFLAENKESENRAVDSSETLSDKVKTHIGSIQASLSQVSEVSELKELVQNQLDNIVETVDVYRQEKHKNKNGVIDRLDALGERLEAMELESGRLKATIEEQRDQALRDALTQLPNRQAYIEHAAKELARQERYGSDLTLVIADVDHFKRINDTYGHLSGDKVLKAIAKEMMKRLRSADFIGRYGGEEFVILMPETDQDAGMKAINTLRESVGNCPFHFREERVPITVSFGVTQVRSGDTIEMAFARADKALYEAKDQGRNRVVMG